MKIVLQRVKRAMVEVNGEVVGQIADGLFLLLGVAHGDTKAGADKLIEKVLKLRLFSDGGSESFMEKNVVEIGGSVLVVSQFTLYGDTDKGTRPSFSDAARPEEAEKLYNYFVQRLIDTQIHVESGRFAAHMEVDLVNDGPITLILDTDAK